jgi:hypothetical protein
VKGCGFYKPLEWRRLILTSVGTKFRILLQHKTLHTVRDRGRQQQLGHWRYSMSTNSLARHFRVLQKTCLILIYIYALLHLLCFEYEDRIAYLDNGCED